MEVLGIDNKAMSVDGKLVKAVQGTSTGDMKKSVYDPTGSVETAGGIPNYVEGKMPTDNNQLTNGAGYITADEAPVQSVNGKTGIIRLSASDVGALPSTTAVPSKTSDLTNDSGYITSVDIPVKSVNNKTGDVTLTASDVGALSNTTVIPSKTSQLDNDSGYITELPIASSTVLGGIKVGAGLSVTSGGVLSATGGGTADAVEWNNVLDTPTTIAGYGITDAKIDNGTITLGNKTITPLTQAPVTSVNSKTGAVTVRELPTVTTSDNGKFLRVANGAWAVVAISDANGGSF